MSIKSVYKIDFSSEKKLEQFIEEKSVEDGICPLTDKEYKLISRQDNLGAYGVSDIIYIDWDDNDCKKTIKVTVIELKITHLVAKDMSQLLRYMKGIERSLLKYKKKLGFEFEINGVLAGKASKHDDFVYLAESVPNVEVISIDLDIESGFVKQPISCGFSKKHESFKDARFVVREAYGYSGY